MATPRKPKPNQPSQPTQPMEEPGDVVGAAEQIIAVFEDRPDLYLAACADPVRAMRDAGIELSDRAARYVALRCRFDPESAEELEQLTRDIERHLGPIDPDDDAAVADALRKVGVEAGDEEQPDEQPDDADRTQRTQRSKGSKRPERPTVRTSVMAAAATVSQTNRWRPAPRPARDPFERYAGAHEVMGPLLEYRRRSAAKLRFADDETYERLARTTGGQLAEGINLTLRVRLTGGG